MTNIAAPPIPLLGYADRLSGRPGDTIAFKVSSRLAEDFDARLVRIICADPNPDGPGLIEEEVAADFAGRYPSREQTFHPGSYVSIERPATIPSEMDLRAEATIWPTRLGRDEQVILAVGDMELAIAANGRLFAQLGGQRVTTAVPLKERAWCKVWLSLDRSAGKLTVGHARNDVHAPQETAEAAVELAEFAGDFAVCIAARLANGRAEKHFNGKI